MYSLFDGVDSDPPEEIIESVGTAYDEADQEAKEAAQAELLEQQKIWKAQMQENALLFLSDTDSIVKRKRRDIDQIIRQRMMKIDDRIRRNADYYYDDIYALGFNDVNSTSYEYDFDGVLPDS